MGSIVVENGRFSCLSMVTGHLIRLIKQARLTRMQAKELLYTLKLSSTIQEANTIIKKKKFQVLKVHRSRQFAVWHALEMGLKNSLLIVSFIVLAITTTMEGRTKELGDNTSRTMELDEKKETGIEDYGWNAGGPNRPLNEMEAPIPSMGS
ncbi:unnamed protein product [Dovyalis caffra]|uniref:Uncharacterized protein n=1 Tax=Dovyalis caffra TaxID=77055 RepID=A0AAV1S267_9ROSI|nr:unnamed protein product [Dovyalis caffra]